jgi:hypothetical protein
MATQLGITHEEAAKLGADAMLDKARTKPALVSRAASSEAMGWTMSRALDRQCGSGAAVFGGMQ